MDFLNNKLDLTQTDDNMEFAPLKDGIYEGLLDIKDFESKVTKSKKGDHMVNLPVKLDSGRMIWVNFMLEGAGTFVLKTAVQSTGKVGVESMSITESLMAISQFPMQFKVITEEYESKEKDENGKYIMKKKNVIEKFIPRTIVEEETPDFSDVNPDDMPF